MPRHPLLHRIASAGAFDLQCSALATGPVGAADQRDRATRGPLPEARAHDRPVFETSRGPTAAIDPAAPAA